MHAPPHREREPVLCDRCCQLGRVHDCRYCSNTGSQHLNHWRSQRLRSKGYFSRQLQLLLKPCICYIYVGTNGVGSPRQSAAGTSGESTLRRCGDLLSSRFDHTAWSGQAHERRAGGRRLLGKKRAKGQAGRAGRHSLARTGRVQRMGNPGEDLRRTRGTSYALCQ